MQKSVNVVLSKRSNIIDFPPASYRFGPFEDPEKAANFLRLRGWKPVEITSSVFGKKYAYTQWTDDAACPNKMTGSEEREQMEYYCTIETILSANQFDQAVAALGH